MAGPPLGINSHSLEDPVTGRSSTQNGPGIVKHNNYPLKYNLEKEYLVKLYDEDFVGLFEVITFFLSYFRPTLKGWFCCQRLSAF